MEWVSIIMPAYNCERFIAESIRSVLSQTYSHWELLIVDDCSTDRTAEVVARFDDSRIHYHCNTRNIGAAETRNEALRIATGRYIAFLDADDIWMPTKLERQIAFMQQHNYAFTYTDYQVINEDGSPTGKRLHVPVSLNYRQYCTNTAIGCLTVMIDKQQTGDFQMPNIRSSHDMALWLLIMKRGFRAYSLPECLSSYRLVSTSNTAKKWKAAKDVWRVYREIERMNILEAIYCFCGYAWHAVIKRL